MPRELTGLMEELAVSLAKDSIAGSPQERDRTDTFKALTTYYLGTTKLGAKEEDEATSSGFGGIKTRLEAVK